MKFICTDLLLEIFSHSSSEELGKIRVLNKDCDSLTYESMFSALHGERTNTISGYFIQNLVANKYVSTFISKGGLLPEISLEFLPRHIEIEASSKQGIMVCKDYHTGRIPAYYICKPTTKEKQKIPNPKTRYYHDRIGLMVLKSNPLQFKIVRFSQPKNQSTYHYNLRCEVFNSETWAWKQLEDATLLLDEFLRFRPAVTACGSLHWLTTKRRIFAWNANNERYSIISLPEIISNSDNGCITELGDYEGKLNVISYLQEENSMELWVKERYGRPEWNRRLRINLERITKNDPYARPFVFCNSDVVVLTVFNKVIFFKSMMTGNRWDVVDLEKVIDHKGIFPFQGDHEPMNLNASIDNKNCSRNKIQRKKEETGIQVVGQ